MIKLVKKLLERHRVCPDCGKKMIMTHTEMSPKNRIMYYYWKCDCAMEAKWLEMGRNGILVRKALKG